MTAPLNWVDVFHQVLIVGSAINEAAFFHRPMRTLVLTDMFENLEADRFHSLFYRLLTPIGGGMEPHGNAPIDLQLTFRKTRREVRLAVEQMITWHPERIVVAHGLCYRSQGVEELARAFQWVLED